MTKDSRTPYSIFSNPSRSPVPGQQKPIPGSESRMAQNNAGGYSFKLDMWKQLERFLILGTDGGTYYVGQAKLTEQNANVVRECLKADPVKTIKMIVDISDAGRAYRNEPALFALALAAASKGNGKLAMDALPQVARIGTHLFQFTDYLNGMRSWGRSIRNGYAQWYNGKTVDQLSYQMAKYQSREGWSHSDILRLAHVKPKDVLVDALFKWACKEKFDREQITGLVDTMLKISDLWEAKDIESIYQLIGKGHVPFEVLPTDIRKDPRVWQEMLPTMGYEAMVRNLGNMTSYGVFKNDEYKKILVGRLANSAELRKSRIHPLKLLIALITYGNGKGTRGSNTWNVDGLVAGILEAAMYSSFKNIVPSGKRIYLALDVSGSMTVGSVCGVEGFTPRHASALMAMVTARSEPNHVIRGFSHEMVDISFDADDKIEKVMRAIGNIPMGGTDCSLPILDAKNKGELFDAFVIYTDSETWAGDEHPHSRLLDYRKRTLNPDVKHIVCGMTATGFTIADPQDENSLDVVGMDSNTPSAISAFVSGFQALPAEVKEEEAAVE